MGKIDAAIWELDIYLKSQVDGSVYKFKTYEEPSRSRPIDIRAPVDKDQVEEDGIWHW